ncbi:MAG: hypothetical protein K0R57_5568 [Paenibacillaceae bacterium]|nr:hypothetical protein [Paenibacillaceae bacterium]
MSRGRNLIISLAAALLSLLLVYGVYLLLIRQVELQETVQVVVPKDFIPAGTLISSDMLEYKTLVHGAVHNGTLRSMEEVVGMESLIPLGTSEPILGWKVDRFNLLPGPDQATFPIPKEYVLSIPGGIRAGDKIVVYASGKLGTVRLLPREIAVASVKSSANTEVDNPDQSNLLGKLNNDREKMYASRRDANGAVEQLNLNLTEEEWQVIDQACSSKLNRLVIAFRASSILQGEAGSQ